MAEAQSDNDADGKRPGAPNISSEAEKRDNDNAQCMAQDAKKGGKKKKKKKKKQTLSPSLSYVPERKAGNNEQRENETDKECVTEPSVGSQPNRTGEGPTSPDTSAPARNDNTRRCESTKTEDGSALDSNESARVENPTDVGTKKGKGSSKEKTTELATNQDGAAARGKQSARGGGGKRPQDADVDQGSNPKMVHTTARTKKQTKNQQKKERKKKNKCPKSPSSTYAEDEDRPVGPTQAEECKIQGLVNTGNTCYMNAALQLLCSTDVLTEFIPESAADNEGSNFMHQFTNLMRMMREKRKEPLNPEDIKGEVGKTFHRFSGDSQQDSQEFLTAVLERVHDSLKTKVGVAPPAARAQGQAQGQTAVVQTEVVQLQAEESWSQYLQQHGCSVVVDMFEGQLVSKLECGTCQHAVVKFDPFTFLSVPVPPCKKSKKSKKEPTHLSECLQLVTKEEVINGWPCPGCHEVVDVKKRVWLCKAPPILMIYLKRYTFDENGQRQKICTDVQFPLMGLDLSSSHMYAPSQGEESHYDLRAVINHFKCSGDNSGHYTTFSKYGDHWFCFNDTDVHPLPELEVVTSDAYVLLYKRSDCKSESKSDVETVSCESKIEKLANTNTLPGADERLQLKGKFLQMLSELKTTIVHLNSSSSISKNEMAEKLTLDVDGIKKEIEMLTCGCVQHIPNISIV